MQIRKILVPIDFSSEGERAMKAVAELAPVLRATVILLHVVENAGAPPVGEAFPPPALLPGTKEELELARKQLAQRRAQFPAGVEVVTEALVGPSVAHAVNDYAVQKGCDVIALSTHGRTGFRRMIMGSIAEAVLRGARVPVLAFPRQT
jgi:nucleotide-binding universal stress UspA family protein